MKERNIAAIATPPGKGGSGHRAHERGQPRFPIAEKMFVPSGKTAVKAFSALSAVSRARSTAEGFSDYGLCVYFTRPCTAIRGKTWWSFTVTAGRISPAVF